MTPAEIREAVLEFARGRLPNGATLEWDGYVHRIKFLWTSIQITMYYPHRQIIVGHSSGEHDMDSVRGWVATMNTAVEFAESIEAFAAGLPKGGDVSDHSNPSSDSAT